MDPAQLSLYYNNFYFDSADYNQPIKTLIDDKIWFSIMPKIRKDADMFVRRNNIKLQDDYVQISGEKTDSFISISGQRETIDDYDSHDLKMVRVYFRVDPIIEEYDRQIYSSGDLLAQVGGVFSFLKAIGAVLVFVFSEKLLISSLAGKLYQVYDVKKDKNKYNEPDAGEGAIELNNSINKSINKSNNKIHNFSQDDEESNFFKANPVRNLFKNTMYCKTKSSDIVKKLRQNKELDEVDRQKIKNLIIARKRLNYTTFDILEYFLC